MTPIPHPFVHFPIDCVFVCAVVLGTKHVDPNTGLIYFKYDFGYEFGILFPGEGHKFVASGNHKQPPTVAEQRAARAKSVRRIAHRPRTFAYRCSTSGRSTMPRIIMPPDMHPSASCRRRCCVAAAAEARRSCMRSTSMLCIISSSGRHRPQRNGPVACRCRLFSKVRSA